MQKSFIAAAAAATIGIGALGIGTTFAAEKAPGPGVDSLITAIADKFHLSTAEVQAVFDEERAKMEADRKTIMEDRLAERVASGKITQAQADAIKAHRDTRPNLHPRMGDMGRPERFDN